MNDLVFIQRGQAVCDSLQVAERFGKLHKNVMRTIANLLDNEAVRNELKNEPVNNGLKNELVDNGLKSEPVDNGLKSEPVKMFQLSRYKDAKGEYRKKYLMNRTGFSLLVMGFTGQEALIWKMKYIEAFNKLELALIQQQTPLWKDTRSYQKEIRRQETDVIKLFIQYAESQGSSHAERYYQLFSLLADRAAGITDRNLATAPQLHYLSQIEGII